VHHPPADLARTGDDTIGRQRLIRHAEERRAMLREQSGLLKRIAIQQQAEALARSELAILMLFGGAFRSAAGSHTFLSFMQRGEMFLMI
jgi:hypothetical protein